MNCTDYPCEPRLFEDDASVPSEAADVALRASDDPEEENFSEPAPAEAEPSAPDVFTEAERTVRECAHLADLERQAQAMQELFPGFDLDAELKNPVFARMTAPDVGIPLEDAYYAVHRRELHAAAMREAAAKTAEKLAASIRSGSRRPGEAGVSAQAPSVSTFDYAKASKQQREDFKKDLRTRMARGEKVYPR